MKGKKFLKDLELVMNMVFIKKDNIYELIEMGIDNYLNKVNEIFLFMI